MEKKEEKSSIEFLNLPSNNYGQGSGVTFDRAPLIYTPSGSGINRSRLPDPKQYQNMNIAYREKFYSEEGLSNIAITQLFMLLGVCNFCVLVIMLMPIIPIITILPLALISGFSLSLFLIIFKKYDPIKIFLYFFLAVLLIFIIYFLGFIIKSNRYIASLLFSVVSLATYYYYGSKPFDFYYDWLCAHPKISNPVLKTLKKEKGKMKPNIEVLVILLVVSFLISVYLPSLSILIITSICLYILKGSISIFRYKGEIWLLLGQYFTYGLNSTNAPGVWSADKSIFRRYITIFALFCSLYLPLSISLNLFFPCDILWFISYCLDYKIVFDQIMETPYSWLLYLAKYQNYDIPIFLTLFFSFTIIAAIFSLMLPLLVFASIYHKNFLQTRSVRNAIDKLPVDRPEWQWYTDRVSTSHQTSEFALEGKIRESDHLFLGVEPQAQYPILLHKKILSEHCYIVGETGSGKTSLGIMPLLIQLIRGNLNQEDTFNSPPPIVILDLKGDSALFNVTKMELEKRRKSLNITDQRYSFRFFTPEKNKSSFYFNPFDSIKTGEKSDNQLCQLLLDSLNLNHGEGYGRSYFSRKNRMILFDALKSEPKAKSFDELYKRLKELVKEKGKAKSEYQESAFELLSTIHSLIQYPMLATSSEVSQEYTIHMPSLIENGQLAYFWLPSAVESISVREIAKLALFSLISSAIDRQRNGQEVRQTYLIIDEFQRIAGENFKIILEQARSFGISTILANQTQSDLNTNNIDLRPTVRTNTRSKMYFSITDPDEVKSLTESSGEEVAIHTSITSGNNTSVTSNSIIKPRLTRNDVISVSDHPLEFILHISRGSGYTQYGGMPLIVRTSYPLTLEEYVNNANKKWPEIQGLTKSFKSPKEIEKEREDLASEHALDLLNKLHNNTNEENL